MVLKINNKSSNFYSYMGPIFGSRSIENLLSDRIYDDDNKDWYIYVKDGIVVAFVSICNSVIKNIYATDEKYLLKIFCTIRKSYNVSSSIVTKIYKNTYEKSGFVFDTKSEYKNFMIIRGDFSNV